MSLAGGYPSAAYNAAVTELTKAQQELAAAKERSEIRKMKEQAKRLREEAAALDLIALMEDKEPS